MRYILLVVHAEDGKWHIAVQSDSLVKALSVRSALLERLPNAENKLIDLDKIEDAF